jgi:hypothetical protein
MDYIAKVYRLVREEVRRPECWTMATRRGFEMRVLNHLYRVRTQQRCHKTYDFDTIITIRNMLSVLTEEKREFSNVRMAAWLLDRDVLYHAREQYDSRYVEGKIYKICIGNNLLYIGSTCKTIQQRIQQTMWLTTCFLPRHMQPAPG